VKVPLFNEFEQIVLADNKVVGYSDVTRVIDGCVDNYWCNEKPRQDQFNSMKMMIQNCHVELLEFKPCKLYETYIPTP